MGGNYDADQLAHTLDDVNAQLTDVALLSQELSARLIASKWSYGLPDNVAGPPVGLNSGMMTPDLTAAIAMVTHDLLHP
jgi:histidine ammonia-lyase